MSYIILKLTTGNHEAFNDFADLKKRFLMPNKAHSHNLYYSFDVNDIHFTSLNSEVPYKFEHQKGYKEAFQDWLRNDLNITQKKWKIVYLHRPLYCSMPDDYHCISSSRYMRELLEEILYENKVDLVLAGHVHSYERLYPIFQGKADKESVEDNGKIYNNPKFPVHLVCGAGGNREGFEDCISLNYFFCFYKFAL